MPEMLKRRHTEDMAPAFVLGGSIAALGIAQSLGRQGVRVQLFGENADDIAHYSRYAIPHRVTSPTDPHAVIDQLVEAAKSYSCKPVLFLSADQPLEMLLPYSELLRQNFLSDELVAPDVVLSVVDKAKFAAVSEEHGFPVPRTLVARTRDDLDAWCQAARYPLVIKPSLSHQWAQAASAHKFMMVKVHDGRELVERWSQLRSSCKALVVQEFIPGDVRHHFSYCAYRARDGRLFGMTVQKIRLYPVRGGSSSCLEVVDDPEIERIGKHVLTTLKMPGTASVCFKRDATTGEPKIFEINGRLPYWHVASQMCGLDIPFMMYLGSQGRQVTATPRRNVGAKWVSLSKDVFAFIELRKNKEISLFSWISSYWRVQKCSEWAWDDMRPFGCLLRGITALARNKIARNLRRMTAKHGSASDTRI